MEAVMSDHAVSVSKVTDADIDALWQLEQRCFTSDRLSKRRMRFYMSAPHAEFVLARAGGPVLGYALLLCRRGTLLTRLYSIAVNNPGLNWVIIRNKLRLKKVKIVVNCKIFS